MKKREYKNPRAELLTHTMSPVESIYCIWQQSKEKDFNMTPHSVMERMNIDEKFKKHVYDIFKKIMRQQIPTNENIEFVFMLHDIPISLREQMVRHRVGSRNGDNFGVDIIPDLAESSWWSQSMRILDFGDFYETEKYFTPVTIKDNPGALEIYDNIMRNLEASYRILVKDCDIPMEDARNILPLASTMGITWRLSLQAFIHIIGKRSCWILQGGMWGFLIKSMIDEISNKIDPVFREAILPPCFVNGEFSDCTFQHENERRLSGDDKLPLCPLYFYRMKIESKTKYAVELSIMYQDMFERAEYYEELWGRNAFTGKKL